MNMDKSSFSASKGWNKRPHINININVNDIEASTAFYSNLFGMPPSKRRVDYAKFESSDPPMNVALLEFPSPKKRDGHFGIQVKSSATVEEIGERLKKGWRKKSSRKKRRWPVAIRCRRRSGRWIRMDITGRFLCQRETPQMPPARRTATVSAMTRRRVGVHGHEAQPALYVTGANTHQQACTTVPRV